MTPQDIVRAVCTARGVSVTTLRSKRRQSAVSRTRHELHWLLSEVTDLSTPDIARLTGCCNHTSVLKGREKIALIVAEQPGYGDALIAMATEDRLSREIRMAREIVALREDLAAREREFVAMAASPAASAAVDEKAAA